jgi:hypothetical protein
MFIIIIRKVRPRLHKARSWKQGRRKSPTKLESHGAILTHRGAAAIIPGVLLGLRFCQSDQCDTPGDATPSIDRQSLRQRSAASVLHRQA